MHTAREVSHRHAFSYHAAGLDMTMPARSALLWLTHLWSPQLQVEFETLLSMPGSDSPDVWLLTDARTPGVTALARRYQRCYVFDEATLLSLPYPKLDGHRLLDHPHFPVLDFFLSHPEYDYYWVVEYDVRYTGAWDTLLRSFHSFDHDFITSHVRRFAQEPYWLWWDTLRHPTKAIAHRDYIRSFNVIYRISNRALAFIHDAQLDGWRGYHEVSLPTLLCAGGFTLLDFGGSGEFALPAFKNKCYTSSGSRAGTLSILGTMRYRPSRARAGMRKNKLYHPVKPAPMIEPFRARRTVVRRWALELIRDAVARDRSF